MLIFIVPVEVGYEVVTAAVAGWEEAKGGWEWADVSWMDSRESRYKLEDSDSIEVVGNRRTYWAFI